MTAPISREDMEAARDALFIGLTYEEAGRALRCSTRTLQRLVRDYRLPRAYLRHGRNYARIAILPVETVRRLVQIRLGRYAHPVPPPPPIPPGLSREQV